MAREGGIFDAASALGIETAMSDAITNMAKCDFSGRTKDDGVALVQQILGEQGAKSLNQTGIWGQCSEDAFMQIFGNPTSQDAVQTFTGLTCGQFTPYGHDRPCVNGNDIPAVAPPPSSQFIRANVARPGATFFNPFTAPTTPVPDMTQQQYTPPVVASKSYTWLYIVGGLALLGVVAYFVMKKPAPKSSAAPPSLLGPPAAPNRRRRHHRRAPIVILK